MKTYVPIIPYYRLSKDKFFCTEEKTVVKMFANIGYAICIEQNVAADVDNYEWYYKSVYRNKLLKCLIYLACRDRIGSRKRVTRNRYTTMLGYDISSWVFIENKKDNNAVMDGLSDG